MIELRTDDQIANRSSVLSFTDCCAKRIQICAAKNMVNVGDSQKQLWLVSLFSLSSIARSEFPGKMSSIRIGV
ncbi:hypothetical protein LWI29_012378 [Acer saccharum]|uniref:Uncharacterized protein n=1 Tax=Acer saccharum TaxID=4024 RepID=A0AA39S752_ACESA|nr:hypothetical protein LWI29_012378 [Acer saccharum]